MRKEMTPIDRMSQVMRAILIIPIRIYQKFISSNLPRVCKYYPSCSCYTVEAIKKHGAVKGTVLGAWRILRCNPFSRGGVDHVPDDFSLTYCFRGSRK